MVVRPALLARAQLSQGRPAWTSTRRPADLGREGLRAATDAVRDDSAAYEDVQQPQVGVTAEVPEAPAEATKDLGKEALIARFRKMALGNSGGPWPSGDDKITGDLTMGDLKSIKQVVATFNLKTNASVRAACGCRSTTRRAARFWPPT